MVSFDPFGTGQHRKYYTAWMSANFRDGKGKIVDFEIFAKEMYDKERHENKEMGMSNNRKFEGAQVLPASREPGYWLNMDVRVSWEIGPGKKESEKKKRFGNERLVFFWRVFAGADSETREQKKVIFEGVSTTMDQAEREVKAAVVKTERLVSLNREGSTGIMMADDAPEEPAEGEII